jgi:hypothetical protein
MSADLKDVCKCVITPMECDFNLKKSKSNCINRNCNHMVDHVCGEDDILNYYGNANGGMHCKVIVGRSVYVSSCHGVYGEIVLEYG